MLEHSLLRVMLVTAGATAGTAATAVVESRQKPELGHRRLDATANQRHGSSELHKHAAIQYPVTQFNHLMESNCRPAQNGFFGSTSGDPAVLEYGFSLESSMFADVERILDVIDEHVMDAVLEQTFQDVCSSPDRSRRNRDRELTLTQVRTSSSANAAGPPGRITGFKFAEETAEKGAGTSFFCVGYRSGLSL